MAQFGWCSLKLSRRLSTHIYLQINKINSIFPNILPLFQSGCRSQQKTPLGRAIPLQCFGSENTIQLGNFASMPFGHLRSGPSTVSCVPLRGTCLQRTPTHYSRSAHQCAGRAVYFAAAKYGKADRPPGVATLVAVRGLVPPK